MKKDSGKTGPKGVFRRLQKIIKNVVCYEDIVEVSGFHSKITPNCLFLISKVLVFVVIIIYGASVFFFFFFLFFK